MNDYKIELGTQLNTKGLKEDVAKLDDKYKVKLGIDLKVNDIKKRIGDYNKNTNNAKLHLKVKLDTDDIKKQINKLNLSGASGGKGVTMTVDTTSLKDSLKDVKSLVADIKNTLGTLDSKSGMKDFLSSINQIATALGKAENESDSLVKSLSALSKKDFSINIGVNMGGSNPIVRNTAYGNKVRNETLPQLKQQTSDLVKFYNGTYKESLNEFEVLQKMVSGTKLSNGDFFENFLFGKDSVVSRMSSGSLASQMQAYKQYMDMFKQAASLKGLDISGVTSSFSKTADDLIKDAQDVQTGANEMQDGFEKLKQVFGGNSINVEGISTQLDSIVADLDEIKVVLQGFSKGISVDGLTQSFDRLSETLEKLVSNAKLVQSVLGDSLGGSASIDTGAINKVEKNSDNSTAAIIQNEKKKQEAYRETAKQLDILKQKATNYSDVGQFIRDNAKDMKAAGITNPKAATQLWKDANYDKGLKLVEMSLEDACDVIRTKLPRNISSGWFREADSEYKSKIENLAITDDDLRNAALNIAWNNYKNFSGKNISLRDFAYSNIPVYRGKNSEKYVTGDDVLSFTFDKNVAEKFGKHVLETMIKPIQTIGAYQTTGESEIFVRRNQLEDRPEYIKWHEDMSGSSVAQTEGLRQEAQQAQESANVVVQAEERKQQAIKETAKETSQLLEYFRKYNAIDKANAPEDSIYHNMDVDSTSLKNAEYHRNQIIKQLTSENGIGKITSLGSIDDGEISQRNLEYFSAMNAELEKLGYTLGEIKANSDNSVLSADIIPIDENTVKDAEEMRNILFGVESQQEKVAQSASDVANTIVQAEEKKQQAYRETADAYERISKDTSLVRDDTDFQKTFKVSNQAAQKAQRHFQELLADEKAVVSVTEQFDNSNALQSFTVNIKRASGEVETLRYAMDKLNDEGDEGFNYQGASANDKSVEKQLEANIKKANDLQVKLDKIKSGYDDMGASKPIKDDNHIKSLEEQYKKVQAAIENVKNADNTAYASMVSNAEKEKAALENMVREFRNAENVATSLRSKDISTVKDTYASKLDVLISKMRKDGVYSSGFEKGAENLRSVLSNATDSSGLTRFLNGLDKLEAGYKRASASAKEFNQSQKVGINVSGLESKIADLQRISPQIDKFETEIDGAKVSVQSLLNDLKQINTQGDFSVVNSRFKAFVDSAKAAGITVAETSKKVKSIGDIKFDFKSGKFDNDVSKIHEKLNRLSNASDELCDSIRAVDAAYEKLDTASKLDTDDITNAKKLTDTYEAYVKVLKTANNELDIQARKETAQARSQKLEQDKKTLKLNTLNWMNENTRAAKEYGTELKKLISLIDKVDDVGLKDVGRQIKNVQKTAQVMGKTGLTVFDKLKAKAKEYMTYLSAAELFMYAEQALRSMFNTVKEIDTAMTGLYRVTDLTAAEYNSLFNDMISSAKEYGATLTDVINATTDWVRAGFNANTSLGLAEVTTMYQHISDLDYDTAAENLITAYNGFKDELNGAFDGDTVGAVNYIADILNELDNNYAATSAGIGEALTRSASALDLAGNSIQETAGMITGIIEVTQDPEQAGSTLKILSLRLRGMKGQLEELGEETDENVENISKMQGQILNLTNGKVNIFDGAGEFRSTYEIMKDISEVWDDLNSTAQADLLETIAGKHRANSVAALMSNWENVEAAVKSATEAEGSAARENAKYVDSIQGRLDKMTTSWQSFANTFMSSDFLKGGISFITNLIENFEKLIDTVGSLPALIGTVAAGISLFKNQGIFKALNTDLDGFLNNIGIAKKSFADLINSFNFGKSGGGLKGGLSAIKNSLSNGLTKSDIANIQAYNQEIRSGTSAQTAWYRTMQTSSEAAQNMVAAAKGGEVALNGMKTATLKSKIAMIGAKAAAIAFNTALTMGISLLIDFAISGIMKVVNAEKELAEKVEELTSKFKEQHDELKKLKSDYDTTNESSMISKYEKLSKGVDNLGRNVSLTSEEYSEYQSIVNSIADQIPSLVTGYDEQGNALLSVKGNVEELTKAYEKLIHAQNTDILTNTDDIEEDFVNKMNEVEGNDWWSRYREWHTNLSPLTKFFVNINPFGAIINGADAIADLTVGNKMTTDTAKALKDLLNTDRDKIKSVVSTYDEQTLSEIKTALEDSDIDVGFWGSLESNVSKALEETLEDDPEKVKNIIDDFYGDLEETIENQKTIAMAKLSEAFDMSGAISGLNYGNINEELQAIAYQTVNSLDYDFFSNLSKSGKSVEQWTKEMLSQLNSISEDDNKEIKAGFELQTKFNNSEISYGEYVQNLKDIETTIDELDLDETAKKQLKISLGLDDEGVVGQYDALLNRLVETSKKKISVGNVIGLELKEAEELLNNLSAEEFSVFNDVIKNFKPISTDEIKEEFNKFEEGGNVDLTLRPEVDTSVLKDAGWENIGEGVATVFTSTFSNAAGDVAMNFTPIMTDENGKHIGTLSPEELQKYAKGVIAGTRKDDLNLQIGAKFKGEDAIAQAVSAAERIHQLQDYYYNGTSAQLQATIDRMMAVQGLTFDLNLEVETAGIESLNTAMAESVSGAGLSSESIAALKARYADLESEGYNLSAMFEETSNGIHIKRKAFRELEKAYAQGKQAEITEDLTALKKEYDLVTQEIEGCNDASERASLYVQRDAILQQINDAATLASQYEGLTSAYNDWLVAEEAGQERDMYEKLIEGFENIDDEISRGWLDDGTIEFLELLSGKDLTAASIKELKEAYKDLDETIGNSKYSVRDFFTVNEDGDSTNTGVYNFLETIESFDKFKDVIKKKDGRITGFNFEVVAEKDEKGNVIKNGDQVIAEALGISEELVQIMLRAADDAGFVINLEGTYTQLADLKTEAEAARDSLISLKNSGLNELKNTDVNFNLNADGQDLADEQAKAVQLLEKFKKNGVIDLKMTGAQEALDVAEYLTIRLDDLTEPRFMQVDASELDVGLQKPFEKMQEIGRLLKEKNLETLLGDPKVIAETESEISAIAEELRELPEETKTKIGIEKDWTTEEIVSAIETGEIEIPAELKLDVQMSDDLKDLRLMMMNQLGLASDNEVKLKIGYDIDDSLVNRLTDGEQEIVVKYLEEHKEVENYTPEQKEAIVEYLVEYGAVEQWSPQTKEAFVEYFVDEENVSLYTPEQKQALAKYIVDGNDISNYTPEQKYAFAKYLVDGGDPEKFDPENKESWVVYGVDSTEIDNFTLDPITGSAIFTPSLGVFPSTGTLTPPTIYGGKVFYNPQLSGSFQSQSNSPRISEVNGTANVNGTTGRAFKRGDWRTKKTETALTGELGREIVVTPDNHWYTVGDTGAEFATIPRGSIVFNHRQTEELLHNGKVTSGGGRAKALVSGTAFASGTAFKGGSSGSGGGIGVTTTKTTTTKETTTTTITSSGSSGSGGVGKVSGKSATSNSNSKSKSSNSSSSSTKDDFEETIDWIEVAISRIEREIDNFDQKVNNVYKSWSERNKNLTSEIGKVGEEIALQQSAYNRYIQEASSIGLSSEWVSKVQSGAIDIDTITDEVLKEKIDDYKKYYEAALDCEDAIQELKETESKLYAQRFENVQTQYDGILRGYEHTESMLNEYISQAEAQGHLVSEKYYNALINNEKQNIEHLKNEQADLIAERDNAVDSGKITKYSEAWYEQCAAIDDVTQAIESGTTALLEYAKAIDEINWQKFDLIQERISDVTAESEFLIELMSNKDLFDDNGKLTGQGAATMGLHALNYNTSMYQVDDYGKEIAKLDKQIKSDPYDQELINRRRELVELQREMILESENSKNAIKDLVEDGINLELDALSELIDKKNEELEAEKDLYEHQKKVSEQTKNIANLRKMLSSYENDNSEESKKRIQELKLELESAEDDLAETEMDRLIENTQKITDDLYNQYSEILNTRLDNLDFLLQQVIDGINAAANSSIEHNNSLLSALGSEGDIANALGVEGAIAQSIVNAMGENGTIKTILNNEANNVGTTLSTAMNNIWSAGEDNAKSVLTTYGTNFQNQQTTTNQTLSGIKLAVDNMASSLNKEAEKKVTANKTSTSAKKDPTKDTATTKKTAPTTTKPKTTDKKSSGDSVAKVGDKVKFVSGQYYCDSEGNTPTGYYNRGKEVYITSINNANWATHPIHISTGNKLGNGDLGWLKRNQLSGYAMGKKKISNNEYAWTQENGQEYIVRPSDGAILTPVAKGDSVLNATASGNIWQMANNPVEFIKNNLGLDSANIPNGANVQSNYTQNLDKVVFNLPNVKNYDELLSAMQKDKNFERLILSMSIDRIAGKSSLAKGKSIR